MLCVVAATASITLSPTRDIAPVRRPVDREEQDMKPGSQRFSSTQRGQPVQQMSTDHENCFPATSPAACGESTESKLPVPVSDPVQKISSTDQTIASARPFSGSDFNTSQDNTPYPETGNSLADKVVRLQSEVVMGALLSDQSETSRHFNQSYPDTASDLALLATAPTPCRTDPVQVESGVCIEDGDIAIPPGKEADELAAAVHAVLPSDTKVTLAAGSQYPMFTAHQVQQATTTDIKMVSPRKGSLPSESVNATATPSSMQESADAPVGVVQSNPHYD